MRRLKNQAGDTIIEVMFAVAVVGMVVAGSFSTANRALRMGRFAHEQTEALKLAESQIEKIKYVITIDPSKNPPNLFDKSNADNRVFCIDDSNPYKKVLTKESDPAASCKNISGLYTIQVTYDGTAEDVFVVRVTWERESSAEKGLIQVSYKVHRT